MTAQSKTTRSDAVRRLPRFAVALLLLALAPAFLTGCGGHPTPPTPSAGVVTLFDVSSSTSNPAVRRLYLDSFQVLVGAMSGGDTLRGYPVTADTQATSLLRIKRDFPRYDPFVSNQDQAQAALASARQGAVRDAAELLHGTPPARSTDLLHAFTDAADMLNAPLLRRAPTRELVVFSDMCHEADGVDFYYQDLTDARDAAIIDGLRRSGDLPSLAGVRVVVVGAAADPVGLFSPEKIAQMRRFWFLYFKACGADLAPQDYGTCLPDDATTGL